MQMRQVGLLLGGLLLVGCASGSAGKIEISLKDLKVTDCPEGTKANSSVSVNDAPNIPSRCYLIVGTAENPGTIAAQDVDIFGKIIDANGTPAITRRRVGSVASIPAGESPFRLEVYLPAISKAPFTLESMKAAGFPTKVLDKR
jgi:hypothetical protein